MIGETFLIRINSKVNEAKSGEKLSKQFTHLRQTVANLSALGPAGVEVATGYSRKEDNLTKREMIKKYVNEKYNKDCDAIRKWLKQNDVDAPYWLGEQQNNGEHTMSIGSQFLARLNEAKKSKEETPAKSVKYDTATERFKKSLRQVGAENLADTIAETLNLLGVPGRFLNTTDVRDTVVASAFDIKKKPTRVTALLALHSALGKATIAEAKVEDLEGTAFQKMVEEIIAELGFSTTEPIILAKIKRKAASFQSNAEIKTSILAFARRFQIKASDKVVGSEKPGMKKLGEANDAMNADDEKRTQGVTSNWAQQAKTVLSALGVNLNDLMPASRKEVVAKMNDAVKNPKMHQAIMRFNSALK